MADGFTYPRNQSSAPAQAISVGKREFTSSADGPPLIQRLGWLAAVFAVIVQQGAFVSVSYTHLSFVPLMLIFRFRPVGTPWC